VKGGKETCVFKSRSSLYLLEGEWLMIQIAVPRYFDALSEVHEHEQVASGSKQLWMSGILRHQNLINHIVTFLSIASREQRRIILQL
jgi:hypothetical protein